MGESVALSLVLCTRNRAVKLSRALEALAVLETDLSWELVLVDNGSSDRTGEIIDAFRRQWSRPLRVVSEPIVGLSRARNAGWRAAVGDLVCFTDDDCYLDAGYLDTVVAAFAASRVGFLGGRVELFDAQDFPISIQPSKHRREFAPGQFVPAGVVQGANMAFRRVVLETIGGFDEELGAGTDFPAEDIDAVCRASLAGWGGVYEPSALVLHHHERRAREAVALKRQYDQGRGAYNAKVLFTRGRMRWLPRAMAWSLRTSLSRPSTPFWEFWGGLRYLHRRGQVSRSRLVGAIEDLCGSHTQ